MPGEKKAIGQAPTENVEAYTYYLRGRQYFHNSTKWFLELARQMFAQGDRARSDVCPRLCRACHLRRRGSPAGSANRFPNDQILANAGKAIALEPDLAEAHAARGEALSGMRRGYGSRGGV